MNILHLDTNHPLLIEELQQLGFVNYEDYTHDKETIARNAQRYHGIVIRSRFTIDRDFIDNAPNLAFIARVGAGLENIDCDYAQKKGIHIISAPEGNYNAVAEHALAMLLSLLNNLHKADREVRQGKWIREANRGVELEGKTVAIIGYGNIGKAFARKLSGLVVEVLCYDVLENVGDEYARQVSLEELQQKAHVVSLHIPQTTQTIGMVNTSFIEKFASPFWLINTARGKNVCTADLVAALQSGKIRGAALDVLEYEATSFETLFPDGNTPPAFTYLAQADNVLLTPHIGGWTLESKEKLARIIVEKIKTLFNR